MGVSFSRFMRENVATGTIPFRKAYIQSVVDRIEVDDGVVRIVDDKSTLKQAVAGCVMASGGVRRRVPMWRAAPDQVREPQAWQEAPPATRPDLDGLRAADADFVVRDGDFIRDHSRVRLPQLRRPVVQFVVRKPGEAVDLIPHDLRLT
jgi:hypothetical protein